MTMSASRLAQALAVGIVACSPVRADVCHWQSPDGAAHFGDRPPLGVEATCKSASSPVPPAVAQGSKQQPAAQPPQYSKAEIDYYRQLAIRSMQSSDPERQAIGRELGRQLDLYEQAAEDVSAAKHERRAIERRFDDIRRDIQRGR